MKRILLAAVCVAAAAACAPDIEKTPAPNYVIARFDPSQVPPVVPTPNDLAADPATGRLAVTPAPSATAADKEFTAFLNTLNGFPASSTARATFSGRLDASTVTVANVRVFDVTAGNAPVSDAVITYANTPEGPSPSAIEIARPAGWTPGKTYLVALVGGGAGLKGEGGEPVIASSTFSLLKSTSSLVTCTDLSAPDCASVTAVIPTDETDPGLQLADRNAKALRLERLRLKYKPSIDALGVPREDLALLWSFKISNNVAMVFDPAAAVPKVPTPNDLAIDRTTGLVKAPIDPNATPAQQEFTRDYLNSLNGFPITATATAAVAGGDLDPATVTADNVLVLELATGAAVTGTTVAYDSTKKQIQIRPPGGAWKKATQYGVVVLSGFEPSGAAFGLKDTAGKPVAASQVWALVRATADVSELTLVELSAAQQTSLAQLQSIYKPLVDAVVKARPTLTREHVVLGWTFRTLNHPEATFDLTSVPPVIPFPNSLAMSPDGGRVNLPNPNNNPLIAGLNTLDGFSLTAPIVTENSLALGAFTDDAGVDEGSLADGGSWAILPLTPNARAPMVKACVNCATEPLADGGTPQVPPQLQFVPVTPLSEATTYGVILKTTAKDTAGRGVRPTGTFALLRMSNPIADSSGKSLVDGVSDAQAAALEPRRAAFKAFTDAAVAAGHARKDMALAWTFRTQSVVSVLKQLHGTGAGLAPVVGPPVPNYLVDLGPDGLNQLPSTVLAVNANVQKFYQGSYNSPWLLTGAGGTFGGAPRVDKVIFNLTIPKAQFGPGGSAPANGWPVVIFGHGLTSFRAAAFAITNSLAAAGFATMFIDAPLHGDRSVCAGFSGAVAACATGTCDATSAISSATFGYCINSANRTACTNDLTCQAAGAGRCLADGQCAGGDFTRGADTKPVISGWNFVNSANLFATRDQFRQQVVDLGQLGRVISANTTTQTNELNDDAMLPAGSKLDPTKIHYAGQSLGGILGTLYTSAAPEVNRAVLNVAGGDPAGILLYAPAFTSAKNAFLAGLALQGVTPGSPAYDQFLYFARMIMDAADPQNAAWNMMNDAAAPPTRAAFIQYISGDLVVPNLLTDRLIAASTRADSSKKAAVFKFDPSDTDLAPASRHGFLLNGVNLTITGQAQQQAATFLVTGAQP